MSEKKKLFKWLQTDAKSFLLTEENVNDKLLKKIKKSRYEKTLSLLNYLIEM